MVPTPTGMASTLTKRSARACAASVAHKRSLITDSVPPNALKITQTKRIPTPKPNPKNVIFRRIVSDSPSPKNLSMYFFLILQLRHLIPPSVVTDQQKQSA